MKNLLNERFAVRSFQIASMVIFGMAGIITTLVFSPFILYGLLKRNWDTVAPALLVAMIAAITIAGMKFLPILMPNP